MWVDDHIIEQLALKYGKTLKNLVLENANKITDLSMMTLGRKCLHLRTLSLICCASITDTGLSEIGKKIHLTELELSHNVRVTDVSVAAILSSSGSLVKLTIVNCPKLTDRTLGALYEADRSWGKQRNLNSQSMQQLVLRDNYNVTTQVQYILTLCHPDPL